MSNELTSFFSHLPCELQQHVAHFLVPSYGTDDEDYGSDTCLQFARLSPAHHTALLSALKHTLIVKDSRVNLHKWQECYPNHFRTIRCHTTPRGSSSREALRCLIQSSSLRSLELSSGLYLDSLRSSSIRELSVSVYTSDQIHLLGNVLYGLHLFDLSLKFPRMRGMCGLLQLSRNHRFLSEKCPFVRRLSIMCAYHHDPYEESKCPALIAALAFPCLKRFKQMKFIRCMEENARTVDSLSSFRNLNTRRAITSVEVCCSRGPFTDLTLEFDKDLTSLPTAGIQLGTCGCGLSCNCDDKWNFIIPGGATHLQRLTLNNSYVSSDMEMLLQTLSMTPKLSALTLLEEMKSADIESVMRTMGSRLCSLGISLVNKTECAAERLCRILYSAREHCQFLHEIRLDVRSIQESRKTNSIELTASLEQKTTLERRLGTHLSNLPPFLKIVDITCGSNLSPAELSSLLL